MKKAAKAALALTLALVIAIPTITFARPMDDVTRRNENGAEFIPLRQAAYAHGYAVEWESETNTVHITSSDGETVSVQLDAFVNAAGGFIEAGTTWIPYAVGVEMFEAQATGQALQYDRTPVVTMFEEIGATAVVTDEGILINFHDVEIILFPGQNMAVVAGQPVE